MAAWSSAKAIFASLGVGIGLFVAFVPVILCLFAIAGSSCDIDLNVSGSNEVCDENKEASRLFLVYLFVFLGGASYTDGGTIGGYGTVEGGAYLTLADYTLPVAAVLGRLWTGMTAFIVFFVIAPKTWYDPDKDAVYH